MGAGLGIVLFAAAIIMAWRQRETVTQALGSVQQFSTPRTLLLAAAIFGTVIGNIVLSGIMFSLLMSRYQPPDVNRRVGWIEMQALIASSTLLNFVPLRPGLLGRVAYHRVYNNIPVSCTAKTIVQAVMLSAVGVVCLASVAFIAQNDAGAKIWMMAAAPLLIAGVLATITPHKAMAGAAGMRYVDLLLTALRYHAAFALLGMPIDGRGAIGFACISAIAGMIPFLSNGLGVREWAVGAFSPVLASSQVTLGITADLLNRAAEIMVIVPVGMIGLAILARIRRGRIQNLHA